MFTNFICRHFKWPSCPASTGYWITLIHSPTLLAQLHSWMVLLLCGIIDISWYVTKSVIQSNLSSLLLILMLRNASLHFQKDYYIVFNLQLASSTEAAQGWKPTAGMAWADAGSICYRNSGWDSYLSHLHISLSFLALLLALLINLIVCLLRVNFLMPCSHVSETTGTYTSLRNNIRTVDASLCHIHIACRI